CKYYLRLVLSGCSLFRVLFFFFFQAEDGIRDFHVTGVQTCALPIFIDGQLEARASIRREQAGEMLAIMDGVLCQFEDDPGRRQRSEERRVGKECRSRWSPDH